jgi:hypothetical protein
MDKAERIAYLQSLVAESPEDPFPQYALCLESEKAGLEKALEWEKLLLVFPSYLPSFFQAGQAFYEASQKDKAVEIWKSGLELALQQSNYHTLAELKSAIQNALVEDEDD